MTNPLITNQDKQEAANKITAYLQSLLARTGLDLTFQLLLRDGCATCNKDDQQDQDAASAPSDPTLTASITVHFTGPDTSLLLERNAELLHAIEHLAAKILGLEPEQHDSISFDAANYKATRHAELERTAELAVAAVRTSGRPHAFAPMTSRERRMLHLILTRSGLSTASSSDGPRRFVVLYPEGGAPPQSSPAASSSMQGTAQRTEAIRNRFRRR